MASGLSITFTEDQLRLTLNKLDMVRLELAIFFHAFP